MQGLTHFELDKYTWTQNMRVNAEKIVVECNHYADIDKQCWKVHNALCNDVQIQRDTVLDAMICQSND